MTFKEFLLLESPHDEEAPIVFTKTWDTYTSDEAIERDYDEIFSIDDVKIYEYKDKWRSHHFRGYVKDINPLTKEQSNRLVFDLQTKQTNFHVFLHLKNPLFVSRVDIDPTYEGKSIPTKVYSYLAKKGITVVSDNVQYTGGKRLWKKVSREAASRGLNVYIYDEKARDLMRDPDGKPISYNGSNIDHAAIWTTGDNRIGYDIVLTLSTVKFD